MTPDARPERPDLSGPPVPDEGLRRRLAERLARRVDATDHGQVLPLTQAALSVEAGSRPDGPGAARRLENLVHALATERVIMPVEVESRASVVAGVHPGGQEEASILLVDTDDAGPSVAVYSSAAALAGDRADARPMPVAARTAALTALVEAAGHLVVDPGGAGVVVPRPATSALAQGDRWLPAWRDVELRAELADLAASRGGPAVLDVRVVFGGGALTRVEIVVDPHGPAGVPPAALRGRLAAAIGAMRTSGRLAAATDRVEITPVWARLA